MTAHQAPTTRTRPPVRGGKSLIPVADVTNAFTSVFAAVAIALAAAYLMVPDIREWLGSRDGLIAWATTATLVMATGIGIWAYRRSATDSSFRLVIPLTGGFLLMQAFRFGADEIGFGLPTITGVEIGSLVDLREVVSINAERLGLGFTTGLLVLTVTAALTAGAAIWARHWALNRVLVTETPVVMWFVASVGTNAAIPVLGFFGEGTGAWFTTAMTGLSAAGFLVIAGLAAGDHRRTAAGWRRRISPWLTNETPLAALPSDPGQ